MQTFNTRQVAPARRVDFWNELCGNLFSPLSIDPLDPDQFSAEMEIGYEGQFKVSRFRTEPVFMERTKAHARSATCTSLTAFLRLDGHAQFEVADRKMPQKPGNIILLDAHTAFQFVAKEPTAALAIGIPDNFVIAHLPNVDRVVGRIIDDSLELHEIIVAMMRRIGAQTEDGQTPSPKLLRGMLELISASFDDTPSIDDEESGSYHAQRWLRRATALIMSNLRDSRLSAGRVAEALGISPRYLRMIFARHGESITCMIQRLRLEESAKCLLNPGWKDVPLSDVASHWGFEDPAYFSRCFKARFGMTPSQYRSAGR